MTTQKKQTRPGRPATGRTRNKLVGWRMTEAEIKEISVAAKSQKETVVDLILIAVREYTKRKCN